MQKIQFSSLPTLAQFGIGASLVFTWTAFEKIIIEPFGVYRFMPFYRVNGFCAWDFLAILAITVVLVRLSRPHTTPSV